MTSSFPPNVGNKRFLVSKVTTAMTATDGTGDTNLTYPFSQFSVEVNFSGVPTAADTIIVGSQTYTWRAAPTTVANEVEIGGDADTCATNFRLVLLDGTNAHSDGVGAGTLYGSATVVNPDILHAEIGIAPNIVHITSATSITITEAADNTTAITLDGVLATATTHYHGGDFTEIKANSSEASKNASQIIGVGAYSNTGTVALMADTGFSIYSHDGVWCGGGLLESPNGMPFHLTPMNIPGGPAARVQITVDDAAMMVYYA